MIVDTDIEEKGTDSVVSQTRNSGSIIDVLNMRNPTKAPYFVYAVVSLVCSVIIGCIGLVGGFLLSYYISHFIASSLNLPDNVGAAIFLLLIIVGLFGMYKVNTWLIKTVCSWFYK